MGTLNIEESVFDEDYDEGYEEDFGNTPGAGGKSNEQKGKVKMFQADKMANGFLFQAEPLSEDNDPFYMETHILGTDKFYISGGSVGTLTLGQMKELRKHLKFLINQMKSSHPETDTGEKTKKKTVLKIDAPWIPSDEQKQTIKNMVDSLLQKDSEDEPDDKTVEVVTDTVVKVLAQLAYQPHEATDNPTPKSKPGVTVTPMTGPMTVYSEKQPEPAAKSYSLTPDAWTNKFLEQQTKPFVPKDITTEEGTPDNGPTHHNPENLIHQWLADETKEVDELGGATNQKGLAEFITTNTKVSGDEPVATQYLSQSVIDEFLKGVVTEK